MRRLNIAAIVLPLLVMMAFGASAMANGTRRRRRSTRAEPGNSVPPSPPPGTP
jgi:hypothetical protein